MYTSEFLPLKVLPLNAKGVHGRIPAEIHLASLATSSSPAAHLWSLAAASLLRGSVKIALIYASVTEKRTKKNTAVSIIKQMTLKVLQVQMAVASSYSPPPLTGGVRGKGWRYAAFREQRICASGTCIQPRYLVQQ